MAVTALSRSLTRYALDPDFRRVLASRTAVTVSASGADVGLKGYAHGVTFVLGVDGGAT